MAAYYNEVDPNAAEWLRQLIKAGAIAPGDVDERDVRDVPSVDLRPYTQCHFFAGIGTWSYALRNAGWEDDRPVWTGSCPCQPFSTAGKRKGSADDRDVWWAMFWHICQLQPETVFGEQVASKDGLAWWDVVRSDLERENYAATAFDLCAAGVGAPHIRQRLFWVAHANDSKWRQIFAQHECDGQDAGWYKATSGFGACRKAGDEQLAYSNGSRHHGRRAGETGASGIERTKEEEWSVCGQEVEGFCEASLGSSFWGNADWLPCKDGRFRQSEPSIFPLAYGITPDLVRDGNSYIQTEATAEAKIMRLKGYGNAIVAPLATAFIEAVREVLV